MSSVMAQSLPYSVGDTSPQPQQGQQGLQSPAFTGQTDKANSTAVTNAANKGGKKDRPCDACRRRKSRCVINDGANICVLCQFHSQECTFLQSPQPRKRRLPGQEQTGEEDVANSAVKKRTRSTDENDYTQQANRRASDAQSQASQLRQTLPPEDYANLKGPTLLKKTLGLQTHRHSNLIGPTSEYEPSLIELCPFDAKDEYKPSHSTDGSIFRRVTDGTTFLLSSLQDSSSKSKEMDDLDAIESIVAPHGQALIHLYFRIVHPSFPIMHKNVFLEKYGRTHREFSPPCLASLYILALNWWSYDKELSSQRKPDVEALEKLALRTLSDVMERPKLSTVQAGLLYLQRPQSDSWVLTCQIVAIAQELGLHLDCTNWRIPPWERGLRKRLAWGVFLQDKWSALTHGRPSHITASNWAVQPVQASDFPENAADEDEEEGSAEVEKGRTLFVEMIELSKITAEVLEKFFTVELLYPSGHDTDQMMVEKVLERAKPVQIKLKEWYARLPECLRMDATKVRKLNSNGYLHLAYFATEITLHRSIIRSLNASTSLYLVHICRTAAKTRLISAMDFVNRLKPEHLQSFWYFASRKNFSLIGSFGSLLWSTSQVSIESEFYKARLDEYRWTLKVSSKGAAFMEFALRALDASAGYCMEGVAANAPEVIKGVRDLTLQARLDYETKVTEEIEAANDARMANNSGPSLNGDGGYQQLYGMSNEGNEHSRASSRHIPRPQNEQDSPYTSRQNGTVSSQLMPGPAGLEFYLSDAQQHIGNYNLDWTEEAENMDTRGYEIDT